LLSCSSALGGRQRSPLPFPPRSRLPPRPPP
jgi:hypothetical protein